MSTFFKIGHRGASAYELENSLASMKKAIELGADVIEADIQVTADEVPIIIHDRLLDRTTNASGYTTDFTLQEFRDNIRLKNGETVPSLEDFCEAIKDTGKVLYLDVKCLGAEGEIIRICKKHLRKDQFFFGSFHYYAIKLVKQIDPGVKTVMIIEGNPIDIVQVIENAGCDIVAMGFDSIEEDSIKVAQEMSKLVFVWVVNDKREIKRAKELGVNGITSDYPDRI